MVIFEFLETPVFAASALVAGIGLLACRLLPLLSDRVNARAVRLLEAKNKRSK